MIHYREVSAQYIQVWVIWITKDLKSSCNFTVNYIYFHIVHSYWLVVLYFLEMHSIGKRICLKLTYLMSYVILQWEEVIKWNSYWCLILYFFKIQSMRIHALGIYLYMGFFFLFMLHFIDLLGEKNRFLRICWLFYSVERRGEDIFTCVGTYRQTFFLGHWCVFTLFNDSFIKE